MSIVRWEPFVGVDDILNRMFPTYGRQAARAASKPAVSDWSPSADISETDKEFLIRAELPAVRKEDAKVSVEDGMITISGERKHESEEKGEKYHRVESFRGSFTRSFYLPENVDEAAIRCESKDGVLTVHLPKKAQSKSTPKEIQIN